MPIVHRYFPSSLRTVPTLKQFITDVSEWFNRAVYHNRSRFSDLIERKDRSRGLVTVSNHRSFVDDPFLWSLRTWSQLYNYCRWTPSAQEIVFRTRFTCWFFGLGRCIPIVRGEGVYQKGMDFTINKLNQGEWVHIFPEGGVVCTKENKQFKTGIGRLVAECDETPIVLPIYHVGMDDVLPVKKPYIPRIGHNVTVVVGEPIDYTEDLKQLRKQNKSPVEIMQYITDKIQEEVWNLREKAEKLHQGRLGNTTKS